MAKCLLDWEHVNAILSKKYLNRPRSLETIRHVIALLGEFEPYIDPGFSKDIFGGDASKFQQRYWEMALGCHLMDLFNIRPKQSPAGPDFSFAIDQLCVHIEAIAPERSDDIIEWYEKEARDRSSWFSPRVFHLRWTHAISAKSHKFEKYKIQGIVRPNDVCIIAVNSGLLGSLGQVGNSNYPAVVDVVFGAGAEYVKIDVGTLTVIETGYRHEPFIEKNRHTLVEKRFFTSEAHSHISAILTSSATPENPTKSIICVHNPFSINPLPRGKIGAAIEYCVEEVDGVLTVRP